MNNAPDDEDDRAAWLDSLSPDESLIVHTSIGHLGVLLHLAKAKAALLTEGIKPDLQLRILEAMNKLAAGLFPADLVSTIAPMSDLEQEIFQTAKELDPPRDKLRDGEVGPSFSVLTSPRVFSHLATLNPSLLSVLRGVQERRELARSALVGGGRFDG